MRTEEGGSEEIQTAQQDRGPGHGRRPIRRDVRRSTGCPAPAQQSIIKLDDQIEKASIRLYNAKAGAQTFEQTPGMFHQFVGAIGSWATERQRKLVHDILECVEIHPKSLPGGALVKNIQFRGPLSIDKIIDVDCRDGGDDLPPDDGPDAGGGVPSPESSCLAGLFSRIEDSTPNPNCVQILVARGASIGQGVSRDRSEPGENQLAGGPHSSRFALFISARVPLIPSGAGYAPAAEASPRLDMDQSWSR